MDINSYALKQTPFFYVLINYFVIILNVTRGELNAGILYKLSISNLY